MSDLLLQLVLKADGTAYVAGVRAAKGETEDLKSSAEGAAGSTGKLARASDDASGAVNKLGNAAKATATKEAELDREQEQAAASARDLARALGDVSGQTDRTGTSATTGAAGVRGLTAAVRGLAPSMATTEAAASGVATQLFGTALAGEAAAAGMGLVTGGASVAAGGLAVMAAGFVLATKVAMEFESSQKPLQNVIERTGQSAIINSIAIRDAATQTAADTGKSYAEVEAASMALIAAHKYTQQQVADLTSAGAMLAATFGGDVASETQVVASAFSQLGNGDATALGEAFLFLDDRTRQVITSLAEAGQTSEAQAEFLRALANTTHGSPGSVSGAFDELSGSIGTWTGAMLATYGPIQDVIGWMKDLAGWARQAAADVRAAANANSESKPVRANGGTLFWGAGTELGVTVARALGPLFGGGKPRNRTRSSTVDGSRPMGGIPLASIVNEATGGFADIDAPKRGGGGGRKPRAPKGDSGAKGVDKEAREAARAVRELKADLEAVTRAFDPAAAAADRFADTIAKIRKLKDAGKLTSGQAMGYEVQASIEAARDQAQAEQRKWEDFYKNLGVNPGKELEKNVENVTKEWEDGGRRAGAAFENRGLAAAQAIAQVLEGGVGGTFGKILGIMQGLETGDFNGAGGKLGGILTLLSGGPKGGSKSESESPFAKGMSDFFDAFKDDLKGIFTDIFGTDGIFSAELQQSLGAVFAGAQIGGAVGKGVTDAIGMKGSKLGGQIGGAIGGAVAGPIGSVVGGILGSVVGGLFKKSKTGSAAVTMVDGSLAVGSAVGNSASFKSAATGLATNVVAGLQNIAEALGGIVSGTPSVSIGVRNGKPVVDTTGANRTKGAGVVKFDKGDEAGAVAFALANALSDGLISGISDKVRAALASSTDIDRALREAIKVDEIERLLDGFGGASKRAFVDFERQAKERLRIAGKYGFDMVELEKINAKERTKLFEQSVEQAVGSLKSLLEDLTTGERAPGTLLDRRDALLAEVERLKPLAATDSDAATKLADALDQLERVSVEAFGTAGAIYAADRANIKSTAEAIITQATADLQAAQDKARANAGTDQTSTDALISQSNNHLGTIASLLDEANGQNAIMANYLRTMAGLGSAGVTNQSTLAAAIMGARFAGREVAG